MQMIQWSFAEEEGEDNNLNDDKDDESFEEVQVEDNEGSLADGNVHGDGEKYMINTLIAVARVRRKAKRR